MKNVRVEVVRNTRNVVLMIRKKIAEIIRATYSAQTFEEVKHILNKPMNIYQRGVSTSLSL